MAGTAYLDESQRGTRYLMAAMAVDGGSVDAVRRRLMCARPLGGRARRHFAKESDAARRTLLGTYRALTGVTVLVADDRGRAPAVVKRERCITLLVRELLTAGATRLVFDHTDRSQRARDRQALARLLRGTDVAYAHEVAHTTEPMLWVPDAVAWCAGAKAEWRGQLDGWATIHRL